MEQIQQIILRQEDMPQQEPNILRYGLVQFKTSYLIIKYALCLIHEIESHNLILDG